MRYFARPALVLSPLLLALITGLLAQQTPYVTGGTVSGRVICADTNAPARFAKVLLKSTAPSHAGEEFMKSIEDSVRKSAAKNGGTPPAPKAQTEEQKKAMAAAARSMDQVTDMLFGSTVGLDGSYSFAGVKPGTYYVHAIVPGYIDPFSQFSAEDFDSADPAIRARIAQLAKVTITGTDGVRVDLRLERGAAVSGRILYDDGAPASGWTISVIKPKSIEDPGEATMEAMSQALAMTGVAQIFKTDDLGRYRISGLAPGDYVVRASLRATGVGISATNMGDGGSGINLSVYSGDTFTRANARAVHLTSGDELPGVDISVPSRALHNISGHVYAKSDSHTLNVGNVALTSKDNPALTLVAAIRDDGSFLFEYLPAGTYTVKVQNAADGRNDGPASNVMGMRLPNPEILRKYATDSTDVVLADADIDSVPFNLAQTDWTPPAKKPRPIDITPGSLVNGMLNGSDDSKP
jgi:hypothetical protein